jgi:glycerophosphoryl diester phosphodiesterase
MVELDVMSTRDGTVVCFHDRHLHATETSRGLTDARGTVWETPDDTVLAAEVLGSGQTVPRLADVLDVLPADVGVNVELKNPGAEGLRFDEALGPDALAAQREVWTPFVADVVDVVTRYEHDVLFSSFYEAALAAARDVAPSVPVGVLTRNSLSDCRTVADRYDAEAIHPPRAFVLDDRRTREVGRRDGASTATTDVVAEAHDAGRAVNVWTVETWYQAERLRRAGVDGIIAEYPFLLQPTDGDVDSDESPPTR